MPTVSSSQTISEAEFSAMPTGDQVLNLEFSRENTKTVYLELFRHKLCKCSLVLILKVSLGSITRAEAHLKVTLKTSPSTWVLKFKWKNA